MKILEFGGYLGLGGTEKAMATWARGLKSRGHSVTVFAIEKGPRSAGLAAAGIETLVCPWEVGALSKLFRTTAPDVIHVHAPGTPAETDLIGEGLKHVRRIPVVQTNIFGRLENPREDQWTDFRLFVSWTSCVQAASRSSHPLDLEFFQRASVAINPVAPATYVSNDERMRFRRAHGVDDGEILFGRISRPEPNKWTSLPVQAFRAAARDNPRIKLLLREPPQQVAQDLRNGPDRNLFVILSATSDERELDFTIASLDAVIHASSIGESFGYGIAEPMSFGKPVIANSTPWGDQAQIELVRHGECGLIASTPQTMKNAISKLAHDEGLRLRLGRSGQVHISQLADPSASVLRVEATLQAAISGQSNRYAVEDLEKARKAATYLAAHQFGQTVRDQVATRRGFYWSRFRSLKRTMLHAGFPRVSEIGPR